MKSHKNDDNTTRIAVLETIVYNISETLKEIKSEIVSFRQEVSEEFKSIRKEFKEEINDVRKESRAQFRWIMGTILVLFGSPFVVEIVKLFKAH